MASEFHLWSSLSSFFVTSGGPPIGEDWALSNAADGGTPIWIDTYTPGATFSPGGAGTYSIAMTTQDWVGDIQPLVPIASYTNFVDPFLNGKNGLGNLASAYINESNATNGSGALIYWGPSSTAGDYEVQFQPISVSYPKAPTSSPLTTLTGSPTTMIAAVADPLNWTYSTSDSSHLVFAYSTTTPGALTENVYFQSFNYSGVADTSPTFIATLAVGTPYYVGYANGQSYYRYLEVGGSLGTGLVGGTYNVSTGTIGNLSMVVALPGFSALYGITSEADSDGNFTRFVEGVKSGENVIQTFLNASSTVEATIAMTDADDFYQVAAVYNPSTGALDNYALAYTDAGAVHLDFFDDNGVEIGSDLVVPGIGNFNRLHTLTGSVASHGTRFEIDYEVPDPAGGYDVKGLIYDTAQAGVDVTLSSGGLFAGSPFDDTYTWGAGDYTVDGGGGVDTFSATNLSPAAITLTIDTAGEVIVNDLAGDIDTLRRFTNINLSSATVTISGNSLTELNADGTKLVSTFNITGQPYTTRQIYYGANGQIEYKLFSGITSEGNLTSFKYLYAGNGFVGADDFYTGVTGQAYTSYETDTDGSGRLTRVAYSGLSGTPYSAYEYDYVAGVYSGSKFTYTSVPAGATYSSYEVDYDQTGALAAEKFFYTGVTGQFYKTEEVDYTFSGGQSQLSRVVLGDIAGEPYTKLEEDYTGGVYSSNKAYYQITGQAFTTEEVDSTAAGQLLRVVYSGFTGTPYSSIEQDYSAGQVSQTIYGFTNVTGDPYNAYQIAENAGGTTLTEIFDFDTGAHRQIAEAPGETLVSLGNDKFSGNASGGVTTFDLTPIYGADSITNLTSSDVVNMSTADFQGFQDLLNHAASPSANVVTATAANGDSLTFNNMTLSTLTSLNGDFHFS